MKIIKYLIGYWPHIDYVWWCVIILIAAVTAIIYQKRCAASVGKTISIVMLVVYTLIFILGAVVLRRDVTKATYNLCLGWTYRAYFFEGKYLLPEILGNIIMMIPLGLLVPYILPEAFEKKKRVGGTFCFCFCFSMMVEVLQYVFHSGLSDVDDVLNNCIGALVGICLYYVVLYIVKKLRISCDNKRKERV